MAIRYLDEQPKASKIKYLDEPNMKIEIKKTFDKQGIELPPEKASRGAWEDYYKKSYQADPMIGSAFGKVRASDYAQGERNILGNIFERPGAGIRSAILGQGYTKGAINPTNVPKFQNLALEKFYGQSDKSPGILKTAMGFPVSAAGMTADILTNPADLLLMIAGKAPTGGGVTLGERVAATKAGQMAQKIGNTPITKENLLKAVRGAGEAVQKVAPRIVTETSPKLLQKNANRYHEVLKPSKGMLNKIEVRSGKKMDDFMKVAADERLQFGKTPDGKLDTSLARQRIADRKVELNAMIDDALESDLSKTVNLRSIEEQANKQLNETVKNASDLKKAKNSIKEQIADEIERYGTDIVSGKQANRIKQGMWEKAYNKDAPTDHVVSQSIGHAIKDNLNNLFTDKALKEANMRLGEYMTLESILEASHGGAIPKGSQLIGGAIGAGIGSAFPGVGQFAGGFAGAKTSEFLTNPLRRVNTMRPPTVSKIKFGK